MSSNEVINVEVEEDTKSPDKKQIEAEEKEVMLKAESEIEAATEQKKDVEGPVKTALSTEFTDQGREVKPKFIPIGGIKMPGFFTRNSDKEKSKDDSANKVGENDTSNTDRKRRNIFQYLHTCPFTQFLHQRNNTQTEPTATATNEESIAPTENRTLLSRLRKLNLKNIKLPKSLQRNGANDPEAAMASLETLDDKQSADNDGMENIKLNAEEVDGQVATKLPLKERIRQRKFILDDIIVGTLGVVILLAAIIGIIVSSLAGPPLERPLRLGKYMVTLTSCGPVEGVLNEGVYNFYNIPYAVPPVNEKRFTYAQPLNNISHCWNGTRDAQTPGPLCLQFLENSTIVGQEDCLTLDIVTPHVRYDSPLPVVVLIGANTMAGGISPLQPSTLYARTEDVVFVRPNFRLGPFGFLALDILSSTKYPKTSGNYALSDLLAALDWINNNIKHFGGDPKSVTLLGHRAGATLTAALTTIKKAQPLYTRVWLSSPSVKFPGNPLEQVHKENEKFKSISKCSDADCLKRITAEEILSVTPDIWLNNDVGTLPILDESKHSWLVLDGDLLRIHANQAWEEAKALGKAKELKPMVFGTTQHSAHSDFLRNKHLNWTSVIVERVINESAIGGKNLTSEVLKHVNSSYEGVVELISGIRTLCPLVALARMQLEAPLYVVGGEGAGGGQGGSFMADIDADVQAILGTFDSDRPEQRRFMTAMQQLFYYYVRYGHVPALDAGLVLITQDAHPLKDLPLCDLLIKDDIVPRYAHVD